MPPTRMARQLQSVASRVAAMGSEAVAGDKIVVLSEVRRARKPKPPPRRSSLASLSLLISMTVVFAAVFLIGVGEIEIERAPPPRDFKEPDPRHESPMPRAPAMPERTVPSPDQQSPGAFVIVIGGDTARGYVIDGDTLAAGARRIRLHGIDAPEIGQTCQSGQKTVACGARAAEVLHGLVSGSRVTCKMSETDRYSRDVGTCFLPDGTDVNEQMVERGWALAYRRYTHVYDRAEGYARNRGLGLWSTAFEAPETWRTGMR